MPARISIIHPFHPLFGQQFEFIEVHHNWHEDRARFRVDEDGRTESVPLSWTSLAAADPFRECSGGRAWFRVEDLLCLVEWIEATRPAREESGEDGV